MKRIIFLVFSALIIDTASAQSINGQWRGFFNEGTNNISLTGGTTEYVLELEIKGDLVSGTSYTYFENRRYFVLCNLNGTYNKKTKKIVVNETERVKGSTPPDWSDCLQTHILYYEKQEGKEVLTGDWKSSPYNTSKGGCGWGATTLSRRIIKNTFTFNKQGRTPAPKPPVVKNTTPPKNNIKPVTSPPVVKTTPKTVKPVPPVVKNDSPAKKELVKADPPAPISEKKTEEKPAVPIDRSFEKRSADVLKTIEIEKENFRVDLYDNGDIDGDTISLFFNGKLLLAHKRLSDKAITLTLNADDAKDVNELVMYAENLGSIPPNTALMVVTDGDNRYEVRISSDLQKSGTIRFVHKPKRTQ
ncbi:MAG: hypothetical protein U0V75_18140 [Ferruginibacter sp.]